MRETVTIVATRTTTATSTPTTTSALHTTANFVSQHPSRGYRGRYHPRQARRDRAGDDVEPAAEESPVPEPAGPGLQAGIQNELPRELQQQPVLPIPVSFMPACRMLYSTQVLKIPGDGLFVHGVCLLFVCLFVFTTFPYFLVVVFSKYAYHMCVFIWFFCPIFRVFCCVCLRLPPLPLFSCCWRGGCV